MRVCKTFEWEAAHKLVLDYTSPCNKLHGHRYVIEVELEGPVNKNGMVMDFSELKRRVNKCSFDHKFLNEYLQSLKRKGYNPTAENLVLWLHWQLMEQWKKSDPKIRRIRIYETRTSFAEEVW